MLANPATNDQHTTPQGWLRRLRFDTQMQQTLVVVALLVVCYSFIRQPWGWNEWSRYALVRAIVDDATLQIDPYHEGTGDKSFYDGHYYSDKMPGSSLLGVPIYAFLRGVDALVGGPAFSDFTMVATLAFFVSGVPTIIVAVLMLDMLRTLTNPRWAMVITVAYALGTIAFPFATMYFGHALSTSLLFISFWLLWRSRDTGGAVMPLLAGFAVGWAVLTEIPVVLGAAILFVYCSWQRPRRALLFVLGGLPALAILLLYNWLAFDNPFSLGYQHTTNFAEQNSQGIVSVVFPSWATAVDLVLSPRGLLRLSPWLALAPVGLVALRQPKHRAPLLVCAAIVVAILTYNSGALAPFGGWTPGPRYLTPALPYAAILVGVAPWAFRPLVALLAAWGVALTTVATMTVPGAPETYVDPVGDLWLPRLMSADLGITRAWTNWGLHGIEPLVLLGAAMLVAWLVLWATTLRARTAALAGATTLALTLLAVVLLVPLPFANQPAMAAVDGGIEYLRPEDGSFYTIWTQLANGPAPMNDVTILFQVVDAEGQETWAGWHDHFSFDARKRDRVSIEWRPETVTPGTYQIDVSVVSQDQSRTFARTPNVAQFVIPATSSGE